MTIAQDTQIPETRSLDPRAAVSTSLLTKKYRTLTALDSVSVNVPAGSIYGIIGPNGAGKTTAFQILATLLQPTSGEASIFGISPTRDPYAARKLLGFMPDFFDVYDDVRVEEYLEFFAASYRIHPAGRMALVADLLELVDLTHKRVDFVESLSRGMKQRLGLARALIHDPALLILDEPASGLDPRARVELRETLQKLHAAGKSVLISSHILSELEEVCTHVAIIEAGKLLAEGTPQQILEARTQSRTFSIRLAGPDSGKLASVALDFDGVIAVEMSGIEGELRMNGDDREVARLLGKLVKGGVPIVSFAEVTTSLEDIFMGITKGVVQ